MRKFIYSFILILIFIATSPLDAKPLVFSELNFSVELPDDWTLLSASNPQYAVLARNNDNTKTLVVAVIKFPPKLSPGALSSGIADFKNSWKVGLIKTGWKISKEQPIVIADIPFITFPGIKNNAFCLNYLTSAGDYLYGIKCELYNAQDPEVLSIINSFRLLSPAKVNSLPPETTTTGYILGVKMHDFLALFTIPALLLIGALIYYNSSMRKKNFPHSID